MAAPDTRRAPLHKAPAQQLPHRLRDEPLPPEGPPDPVADLRLTRRIRRIGGKYAHGTDGLLRPFPQQYRQRVRLGQHRSDDPAALLHGLVGLPSRRGANLSVAGVAVQALRVLLLPGPQHQPLRCQHHSQSSFGSIQPSMYAFSRPMIRGVHTAVTSTVSPYSTPSTLASRYSPSSSPALS